MESANRFGYISVNAHKKELIEFCMSTIESLSDTSSGSTVASTDSKEERLKSSKDTVSKNFERLQSGKFYAKDLIAIFSILMLRLELSPLYDSKAKGLFKAFQQKQYPFCFSLHEAISQMRDLKLVVNLPATTTSFSYSVKSELATSLIKKFMKARLIHSPADKTRNIPKTGVALQPTPKGCAVLQRFCMKIGLRGTQLPLILNTNFNTMDLIFFDRNLVTDTIIQSEYFMHLLFVRFMGPRPNVWDSSNKPDPLPLLLRNHEEDVLEFALNFNTPGLEPFDEWDTNKEIEILDIWDTKDEPHGNASQDEAHLSDDLVSPFYHKYFSNPDSDALVQYYVSDQGVRFCKQREFGDSRSTFGHVFTGKAAVQWFMDCTETFSKLEAADMMSLMIKYDLVRPIVLAPSRSPRKGFSMGSDCFYTLAPKGYKLVQWGKTEGNNISNLCQYGFMDISQKLSLGAILKDPGSRFLFRVHLEKELCVENLDAYIEIVEFLKRFSFLKKMSIISKDSGNHFNSKRISRSKAINNLANDCLSKAYAIYSSYLSYGSPYEINISNEWKDEALDILVRSDRMKGLESSSQPVYGDGMNDLKISESTTELKMSKPPSFDLSDMKEFIPEVPLSPTTKSMEECMKLLDRIAPLFQKINGHIFFLLSQDSFPKFLKSDVFQALNSNLKISTTNLQSNIST